MYINKLDLWGRFNGIIFPKVNIQNNIYTVASKYSVSQDEKQLLTPNTQNGCNYVIPSIIGSVEIQ